MTSCKENLFAGDANVCVCVPALLILKMGEECEEDIFVLNSTTADKTLFTAKLGITKARINEHDT